MNLIDQRNCTIAIIGLGYVGLPLFVEFSNTKICRKTEEKLNRNILGFDINKKRIQHLKQNIDLTAEVTKEELIFINKRNLTYDKDRLLEADIFIITVPTPIDEFKNPDLEPIKNATKLVGDILKQKKDRNLTHNPIIIYESTVFPSTTEEICVPILEEYSGLTFNEFESGEGFFCGYSPERINPGDKNHRLKDIVKITSGSLPIITDLVDDLYASIIIAGTHKVSSIKVAEAAKIIENIQRDINIALINELAIVFKKMNVDTLDVLEASGTKWNFLPFRPGLVGGHCIGVDPYYLTFKANQIGCETNLILAGRKINDAMPSFIAKNFIEKMIQKKLDIKFSRILILGLTFKENCPDLRNSKVIELINILKEKKLNIDIYDPYADFELAKELIGIEIFKDIPEKKYNGMIAAVKHKNFEKVSLKKWKNIIYENRLIFDLKGFLPRQIVDFRL
tara:strand:- start:2127 stop:3482 length:1356 start_codon:yes stop_codon:yes gene_type:complete